MLHTIGLVDAIEVKHCVSESSKAIALILNISFSSLPLIITLMIDIVGFSIRLFFFLSISILLFLDICSPFRARMECCKISDPAGFWHIDYSNRYKTWRKRTIWRCSWIFSLVRLIFFLYFTFAIRTKMRYRMLWNSKNATDSCEDEKKTRFILF